MIPELFSNEPALFEPRRLAIACAVAQESDSEMTFVQLKRMLGLTDGNLNRHLHRLTGDGILTCTREKQAGRRPRTVVRITPRGRNRLAAFADALAAAATHGRAVTALRSDATGRPNAAESRAPKNSVMQSEVLQPEIPLLAHVRAASIVDDRFAGVD